MRKIGAAKPAWITVPAISAAALAGFLLVPWLPRMPSAGLDPSWMYAVNEAVARHLVFGRDLVFTFGPLGSVYTQFYGPATDAIMLGGSALLAVALCAGVTALIWWRLYLIYLLPIVVAESLHRDAFLMALPLLLLLITFRLTSAPESRHHLAPSRGAVFSVSVLSCAVGIMPLIKGTVLALAVVEGGLAVLVAAARRRTTLALGIAVLAVTALCVGWGVAGQPLTALPYFFWAQEPVIAGYSEAMSLEGPFFELLFWVVPMVAITAIFYFFLVRGNGLGGCLVFLGFAFYSFVTFKEGFVRLGGHQIITAECFLFIGFFLVALIELWPAIAVGVISTLAWAALEGAASDFGAGTIRARFENTVHGAASGIILRVSSPDALHAAFNEANSAIRAASPLPRVKGTADLYPNDLSLLFADGMRWDGRPIMQSYSAYTAALAAANAAHLVGSDAPENIFFAVEPIDGRLPALEDAASWPLLLSRYSIIGFYGNYLQMRRLVQPTLMLFNPPSPVITAKVDEWVRVPPGGGLVWASIDMRPTILGSLVLAVFKLPQVWIELKLADGRMIRNRYIPEMGRAGFLLSPYVGSTSDFAMAAAGSDKGRGVEQIKLETPAVGLWARRIGFSFRALNIPLQTDVRRFVLIQPSAAPLIVSASADVRIEDCSLDTIDGQLFGSLRDPILVHDDEVGATGWTAPSGRQGIGPDETWVSLTAEDGERRFYQAKATERPDVLAYFKQPEMKKPGFLADMDMSGLSGTQTLTIYSRRGDEAFRCPQSAVLKLGPVNQPPVGSMAK